MSIQQIVSPDRIEAELQIMWEGLAKESKMRASLFNLIVYNHLSPRTDYFRNIVQKVIEKFPCRILFISFDADASQNYLKTAISIVTPSKMETTIACDNIDIGVAGNELEKIPFLILPHIVPDLPVYLLWAEDPSLKNPIFEPLLKMADRIIFDSEGADNLLHFSQTLLELYDRQKIDIADLNWARTEGWRDLFASTFDSEERIKHLKSLTHFTITYNARETEFFCHLKIQSLYLLAWLSNQIGWKFLESQASPEKLSFHFTLPSEQEYKSIFFIQSENWHKLGPGTIISVDLISKDGHMYTCARIPEHYHRVAIQISTPNQCDLPYQFILGKTATGQSLVKEICTKGTSAHYLKVLQELLEIDRGKLC